MSRTASPRAPRESGCTNTILPTRSVPDLGQGVGRQTHGQDAFGPEALSRPVLAGPRWSGCDVWFDLAEDSLLAARTDDASHLLAILEHDQCRDAHDGELPRRLRVVVHVHLDGLDAAGLVPGDLL